MTDDQPEQITSCASADVPSNIIEEVVDKLDEQQTKVERQEEAIKKIETHDP